MATVLNYSTKKGQQIFAMGLRNKGYHLHDVYTTFSAKKQAAWDWCYDKFLHTLEHENWRICSASNMFFTVSWIGKYNGKKAMFVETKSNSYIVVMD